MKRKEAGDESPGKRANGLCRHEGGNTSERQDGSPRECEDLIRFNIYHRNTKDVYNIKKEDGMQLDIINFIKSLAGEALSPPV